VGKIGGTEILSFFSMVDVLRPLHLEVMERLRGAEQLKVLGAAIPVADEVELMGEERNPVAVFAPAGAAAVAYEALWVEIQGRLRPGSVPAAAVVPPVEGVELPMSDVASEPPAQTPTL
jgi:hypothetical protein